ncbi:MAG: ABC transporter permease, partial [Thermoguttaceae bacterium]|nr:ABC transporter permease [Thermoguttaceae bacterium]
RDQPGGEQRMSLWKIAWRSIQHRALASALTAFSMALGVALVVAVLVIHSVIDQSFRRSAQGYDLIVGPKGSPLELVLTTVYHLGKPIGTISHKQYMDVAFGQYAQDIELAIPICTGENYKGYRIIGTVPEFFDKLEYRDGQHYEFAAGNNFSAAGFYEAVVGATAARKTGLVVGSEFRPTHGLEEGQGAEHAPFTVVGVLAPTGTPNDRAVFINIEGFYLMHEHGAEGEEHEHDDEPAAAGAAEDAHDGHAHEEAAQGDGAEGEQALGAGANGEGGAAGHEDLAHEGHSHGEEGALDHRAVSAVLILTNQADPTRRIALPRWISEQAGIQAVAPAEVITNLFQGIVGNVQLVLMVLAVLVVIVAGIGMLVSIYNSMSDRRHEIAVMRALGARRNTVMSIVLLESILLSLGGGAVGVIIGHALTGALAPLIMEHTGVVVSALQFQWAELILIPGLVVLATVVGYLPAVIAYKTDVAQSLTAKP